MENFIRNILKSLGVGQKSIAPTVNRTAHSVAGRAPSATQPGSPLVPSECRVKIAVTVPAKIKSGERFAVECSLTNLGPATLASANPNPVYLSYKLLRDPSGEQWDDEGLRTELTKPLAPNGTATMRMEVIAPKFPGRYLLRVTPVQEFVAWFDEVDASNAHTVNIAVS